jgi:hypothetical protein
MLLDFRAAGQVLLSVIYVETVHLVYISIVLLSGRNRIVLVHCTKFADEQYKKYYVPQWRRKPNLLIWWLSIDYKGPQFAKFYSQNSILRRSIKRAT